MLQAIQNIRTYYFCYMLSFNLNSFNHPINQMMLLLHVHIHIKCEYISIYGPYWMYFINADGMKNGRQNKILSNKLMTI